MIGCAKRRGRSFFAEALDCELAEHLLVMAIPVALKESSGIVLCLELQELLKLRIAGFHLSPLSALHPRATVQRRARLSDRRVIGIRQFEQWRLDGTLRWGGLLVHGSRF